MLLPCGRPRRVAARYAAAGLAGLAVAGAVGLGRRRVSAFIQDTRQHVEAAMGRLATDPQAADALAGLPAPVQRYLETVLEPGQSHVEGLSLTQAGEIRLGGPEGSWRPFEATGVYSVSPPASVWDADIALPAFVPARVFDAHVDGDGWLRANLLGAVPVARAGPDPAMNEAELQRYLAETPWFPTALLSAAGISWEGLDDERARATIVDGGVTASVVFHVDETGHVDRVTADRYRQDTGDRAPRIGTYREYEGRTEMTIPTAGEGAWDGPAGPEPYWRGRITAVGYRTA